MNRFEFLRKAVLGVSGLGFLGFFSSNTLDSISHESASLKLITTNIAGFSYYQGPENLDKIKIEDPLILRREKTNVNDFFAIEVLWKGLKLGYIVSARKLSNFMK